MKTVFLVFAILGSSGYLLYPLFGGSSKKLLFENKYWKVYNVVKNNFPAGKENFYEVFFKKNKVTLPDTIGGSHKVDSFVAANGFQPGEFYSDAVIVIFKYYPVKNVGNHDYKTLIIRPKYSYSDELVFEFLKN
jgi:hypothetical protein